jgi:hypothetical protein
MGANAFQSKLGNVWGALASRKPWVGIMPSDMCSFSAFQPVTSWAVTNEQVLCVDHQMRVIRYSGSGSGQGQDGSATVNGPNIPMDTG